MSFISLTRLLNEGRLVETPVATVAGEVMSFARFRMAVAWNAEAFRQQRIRRALLVTEDAYDFAVGMFALLHAGADVVLPANAQPGTLATLAGGVDAFVTDQPRAGVEAVVIERRAGTAPLGLLDSAARRIDFFTSGSTAEPKRIEKRLFMLDREVEAIQSVWGRGFEGAPVVGTVSHQHAYGLPFKVLWPLASGRCFDGAVFQAWEALLAALWRPAVIVSSPAHLTRLVGLPALPAAARPLGVFTAGAPLLPAAALETESLFGVAPTEIFGSTETGAVAWRHGTQDHGLWRALPQVAVAADPEGHLTVVTPFAAEPCRLGDRVEFAPDGRFLLRGRGDRIVKVEGKRVSLPELEGQIVALPWIREVRAVLLSQGRDFIGVAAVLSQAGAREIDRLGKFRFERLLRRQLADAQDPMALPRRWRFVEVLPVDHMGKCRTSEIEALLCDGSGRERRLA